MNSKIVKLSCGCYNIDLIIESYSECPKCKKEIKKDDINIDCFLNNLSDIEFKNKSLEERDLSIDNIVEFINSKFHSYYQRFNIIERDREINDYNLFEEYLYFKNKVNKIKEQIIYNFNIIRQLQHYH